MGILVLQGSETRASSWKCFTWEAREKLVSGRDFGFLDTPSGVFVGLIGSASALKDDLVLVSGLDRFWWALAFCGDRQSISWI